MDWHDIASASVTLFLIMDPLGNVPVFNAVLSKFDGSRRMMVIARELCVALIILLGFLFAGNAILGFLGLSQSSLNIAGCVAFSAAGSRKAWVASVGTADGHDSGHARYANAPERRSRFRGEPLSRLLRLLALAGFGLRAHFLVEVLEL